MPYSRERLEYRTTMVFSDEDHDDFGGSILYDLGRWVLALEEQFAVQAGEGERLDAALSEPCVNIADDGAKRTDSPLVEGVTFPKGYCGGKSPGEHSAFLSLPDVDRNSYGTPLRWAMEYDFGPRGYDGGVRVHVACSLESDEVYTLTVRISSYVGDEGKRIDGVFVSAMVSMLIDKMAELKPTIDRYRVVTHAIHLPAAADIIPPADAASLGIEPIQESLFDRFGILFDGDLSWPEGMSTQAKEIWRLFSGMLHDREREMPVVLMRSNRFREYGIDPSILAKRLAGMAFVFAADSSASDVNTMVNRVFGKGRGVADDFRFPQGSLRVFPGKLDITRAEQADRCYSQRLIGADSESDVSAAVENVATMITLMREVQDDQ